MRASQFTVELPGFRGSLEDLVLAVHQQRLSLLELPLDSLTGQLLQFLRQRDAAKRLDGLAEWLDLAARLIRWKSLALLPLEPNCRAAADADLREEIRTQFREIERARIGRLRDLLGERLLAAGGSIDAPPEVGSFGPELPEESERFPSLWTLRQKFQTLRTRARQHRQAEHFLYNIAEAEDTVEQMQSWVLERLQHAAPGTWTGTSELFAEVLSRPRQVALFQALLELARGAIWITQRPDEELVVAVRTAGDYIRDVNECFLNTIV